MQVGRNNALVELPSPIALDHLTLARAASVPGVARDPSESRNSPSRTLKSRTTSPPPSPASARQARSTTLPPRPVHPVVAAVALVARRARQSRGLGRGMGDRRSGPDAAVPGRRSCFQPSPAVRKGEGRRRQGERGNGLSVGIGTAGLGRSPPADRRPTATTAATKNLPDRSRSPSKPGHFVEAGKDSHDADHSLAGPECRGDRSTAGRQRPPLGGTTEAPVPPRRCATEIARIRTPADAPKSLRGRRRGRLINDGPRRRSRPERRAGRLASATPSSNGAVEGRPCRHAPPPVRDIYCHGERVLWEPACTFGAARSRR